MECSVRVIKGPNSGESCTLKPGVNLIGRSLKASLTLTSPDISWEHFSITRSGDQCVAENLSAAGTYLEDVKLTGPVKLRPRDQLRISKDTVLRFETTGPAEGGFFSGTKGLVVLLLILLGLVAAVIWAIVHSQPPANWSAAYAQLDTWAAQETAAHRLPDEALDLFRDAWRLEGAEDFKGSEKVWLRLRLELDDLDNQKSFSTLAAENPNALARLVSPSQKSPADPTYDEMAAAFSEFVSKRLSWSSAQVKLMK